MYRMWIIICIRKTDSYGLFIFSCNFEDSLSSTYKCNFLGADNKQ